MLVWCVQTQLVEAMVELVHSGLLCVSQTNHGLMIGYLPGCQPPPPGKRPEPPPARSDADEVRSFQQRARQELRKQLDEASLKPQEAAAMPNLGIELDAVDARAAAPDANSSAVGAVAQAAQAAQAAQTQAQACIQSHLVPTVVSTAMPQPSPSARAKPMQAQPTLVQPMQVATAMPCVPAISITQAQAAAATSSMVPGSNIPPTTQAAVATPSSHTCASMQPPPAPRISCAPPPPPPTWQAHLVGWTIEAQQYTSGAMVRGTVRSWEPDSQTFTLAFENGARARRRMMMETGRAPPVAVLHVYCTHAARAVRV